MTTFTEVWEQFTYHCRVKRRSSNTLTYYGTTAKALAGFLETEGIVDLEQLSVKHLRAYLDHLERRGLGPGGLHAHARAVKAIFNWACREELLARNPALRLERPSVPKVRLPTVTPENVSKLIGTSKDGDQPQRDTALILTLFDTGVRVSELTALRLEDLQFERGLIRVQGKGDKQRMVPIGSSAITAVTRYQRRERRPASPGVHQVFLGRYGEALTRSGVAQRLTLLGREVKLERDVIAPHAFRRGFAVEFLRNGGDVFSLQQILGHSSLEMTRRYVNFLDEDLKAAHLRFSPGDRL